MKVFFVEYNHYEDHDFYSGWTTREATEKALAKLLKEAQEWDKHCYDINEYEVSE